MEFRYLCSGCSNLYCEKHLDWKYGHTCSGYQLKIQSNHDKLIQKMPKITTAKLERI